MGKKTVSEIQDAILNQFERVIRNGKLNPGPTQIQQLIAESVKKNAAYENRKPQPKPFISYYDPNNPLNQLRGLNNEQRKQKMKELKQAGLIK